MSKYRISYKKGNEYVPIDFMKIINLSTVKINDVADFLHIDVTRLIKFIDNYNKNILEEMKAKKVYNKDDLDDMYPPLLATLLRKYNTENFKTVLEMKKTISKITFIDAFTSMFNNLDEMLKFLKRTNIIDNSVKELYLTKDLKIKKEKKIKQKLYMYPNKFFYKKEKNKFSKSYVEELIKNNIDNAEFTSNIAKHYSNKYIIKYKKLYQICEIMNDFAELVKVKTYAKLSEEKQEEFKKILDKFIALEFTKKTAEDNYITDHLAIREFICLINGEKTYIEKTNEYKEKSQPEEIEKNKYEQEEFLTLTDFNKSNSEILDNYKKPKWKSFVDGHDYVEPLGKRDLSISLNDVAKKLILKPDDRDLN